MASSIQIPNNAPFTPEQRQWLGEFLGNILSQSSAASHSAGPAVPLTVLFGSQTGTAEGLAKKLIKTLKKGNFEPTLQDMGAYDRELLAKEKNLGTSHMVDERCRTASRRRQLLGAFFG
jgi:sulfite reductase (NADPH) flavoprotein alpha-component